MAELIRIGNSQGIRIPKVLIEQAGLENTELELKVAYGGLLIKPRRHPRAGWKEALEAAAKEGKLTYDSEWLEADLDSELDKIYAEETKE